MHKKLLTLVAIMVTVPAWSADTPSASSAATSSTSAGSTAAKPAAPTTEQVMEQFRTDLQSGSADVMAKGLVLTSDQAAKFWPLFETFQKEQAVIVDEQIKALQKYAEAYAKMSDADAVSFISDQLKRDAKVQQLRVKWLEEFQKVVPGKIAARAIQIDRRLSQVVQIKVASQIPLIR